ncbi:MAG: YraN family protein [Synechococcaceae cyanobacterium]|nr:YraN family protein [Synechococcaceae cyanobacterium]
MARTRSQRGGLWAEQRALRLLRNRGWSLEARNWRCRWGELDLVLAKPQRLLLVEVKGRRCCGPDGHGLAAIGPAKRRRLIRCCHCWLALHPHWGEASIELVAALVPLPPSREAVRWVRLLE